MIMDIAKHIDHSLLRPDATDRDVSRLCEEAEEYGFDSVCIHPSFVKTVKEALFRTHVKTATVIGFPLGMTLTRVKLYESIESVINGADELDIVINIGLAKSGNWAAVEKEISDLVAATPGTVHKIIIETCYLTENEKKSACNAIMNAGAEFIKTSTGFGTAGADIKDVELIKSLAQNKLGVKAAGGIDTLEKTIAFINAGATRIGTSSGVKIMKEVAETGQSH